MAPDISFREGMLAALPNLRFYALSLVHDPIRADDLVQDTLLRAWARADRFTPGTNLHAWLFTILRNSFYSAYRRRKREVDDPDGSYARRLRACPEQQARLDFEDFRTALAKLRPDQREALILVGAEGRSYEETAALCGVPVGTIKSRVSRARCHLHDLLSVEAEEDLGPDTLMRAALQDLWARVISANELNDSRRFR
jgi:RNA polymerase sigma-70 factor, ECF subfamily